MNCYIKGITFFLIEVIQSAVISLKTKICNSHILHSLSPPQLKKNFVFMTFLRSFRVRHFSNANKVFMSFFTEMTEFLQKWQKFFPMQIKFLWEFFYRNDRIRCLLNFENISSHEIEIKFGGIHFIQKKESVGFFSFWL